MTKKISHQNVTFIKDFVPTVQFYHESPTVQCVFIYVSSSIVSMEARVGRNLDRWLAKVWYLGGLAGVSNEKRKAR